MFRNSSALARGAKLAAAAASGCVVLAACGSVQMGAAAIMGGQRISSASLGTQVSNLTRSYHAEGKKAQLAFPVAQMPQQVLDDPHVLAMGFFQPVDYPGLSKPAPIARAPVRLSKTPNIGFRMGMSRRHAVGMVSA